MSDDPKGLAAFTIKVLTMEDMCALFDKLQEEGRQPREPRPLVMSRAELEFCLKAYGP